MSDPLNAANNLPHGPHERIYQVSCPLSGALACSAVIPARGNAERTSLTTRNWHPRNLYKSVAINAGNLQANQNIVSAVSTFSLPT